MRLSRLPLSGTRLPGSNCHRGRLRSLQHAPRRLSGKVYERALVAELTARGIAARTQVTYPVHYKGKLVGEYVPDLVVEDQLIVELKCVDQIAPVHLAQCLSYLHASGLTLALLITFRHPKVACRRVVLSH